MKLLSQLETSTPLSIIDSSSKPKNQQNISWNTTVKLDLMDTHEILHPAIREHTFFSSTHGTFTKIDHVQDHRVSLNKKKKKTTFSKHITIKLHDNNKKIKM